MTKCKAVDSFGNVCKKEMTSLERNQDGMCSHCADNIWEEMTGKDLNYKWRVKSEEKNLR